MISYHFQTKRKIFFFALSCGGLLQPPDYEVLETITQHSFSTLNDGFRS